MKRNEFLALENLNFRNGLNKSSDLIDNLYRVLINKRRDDFENKINNLFEWDLIGYITEGAKEVEMYQGDYHSLIQIINIIKCFDINDIFDFIDFVNERLGSKECGPYVPKKLSELMLSKIRLDDKKVLIAEPEKFGISLYNSIKEHSKTNFILAFSEYSQRKYLYKLLFEDFENVTFKEYSIYNENSILEKFDAIVSFPAFNIKIDNPFNNFICSESSLVALQNLLYYLTPSGKLVMVLPAKITFGGASVEVLRRYIEENYKINEINALPTKSFYPYMALNTYLFSFGSGITDEIIVRKYNTSKPITLKDKDYELVIENENLIFRDELEEMHNWNIDMLFKEKDKDLEEYYDSLVKKSRLDEVADVYRGRAIFEKAPSGSIAVINIKDIKDNEIDYSDLDTIEEEERKVSNYVLQEGDVLISSKGTTVKVAVFHKQEKICIASANLSIIRTKEKLLTGEYLRLFLISNVGIKLINSLQRGTTIVNINIKDLEMLEVPTPSIAIQESIVNEYNAGQKLYKEIVKSAQEAWDITQKDIFNKLY